MPCIVFQDEERAILISKGATILQASLENKVPQYFECGGKGTCTTCRVRVLSGHENLMTRNQNELKIAKSRNWDKTIRLACQARILGDIVIEKIIKNEEDAFRAYLESYYYSNPVFPKELAFLVLKIFNFEDVITSNSKELAREKLEKIFSIIRNIGVMNAGYVVEFQSRFILFAFGLYDENSNHIENAIRSSLLIKREFEKIQKTFKSDLSIQNLNYGIVIHAASINAIALEKYKLILFEGKGLHEINFFSKLLQKLPKSILISERACKFSNFKNHECKKFRAKNRENESFTFYSLNEDSFSDEFYTIYSSYLSIRERKTEFLDSIFQIIFEKNSSLDERIGSDRERLKLQIFHLFNQLIFGLTRFSTISDMLKELGRRLKFFGFHESDVLELKEVLYQTLKKFFTNEWNEGLELAWKNLIERVWKNLINGFFEEN